MRILIAPDKFAGTMSSSDAGHAIARGWLEVRPGDDVRLVPMADGGPGTVGAIAAAKRLPIGYARTVDQLGHRVQAPWVSLKDGVAVVEAASACGLHLVSEEDRDPLAHNSSGVGLLIRSLLEDGFRQVVVGLGGTGTIDGGLGAAIALGASAFTSSGPLTTEFPPTELLAVSKLEPVPPSDASLVAAADVSTPLLGEQGAARLFGPQKGASPDDVDLLERALSHFADVAESSLAGRTWREQPGVGAGGGLGFGLLTLAGAAVVEGARLVGDLVGLAEHIHWADLVITGEGSFDEQSMAGKAPDEVRRIAALAGKPSAAVVGQICPHLAHVFDHIEVLGPAGLKEPGRAASRAGSRLALQFAGQPGSLRAAEF